MTHAVVIGAGLGGLAAALFLARRGHEVDLFERDGDEPPEGADACFDGWLRRGVPQARQGHAFLGLSSKVLREEAPDVLTAIHAAGADVTTPAFVPVTPDLEMLAARRLVYESVLRRIVCAESKVTLHRGVSVDALIAKPGAQAPHVVGVRTADGQECRGDLVVDASGRWTRAAEWLAAIGARPWREQAMESPFVYITRYYRLKPGLAYPGGNEGVGADLSYGSATSFISDNRTFAMVYVTSTREPHRAAITKRFEAIFAAIPALAQRLEAGTPINDPLPLGRIDNRRRALVDDTGPIVSGFVLIGDAALHTNPVFGRGVSLALSHAQHLAQTVEQADRDPLAYAAAFQDWTRKNISVWYSGSVQADVGKAEQMERAFRGEETPVSPMSLAALGPAMNELIKDDPDLARRWARLAHLIDPPYLLFQDPTLMMRVQETLTARPDLIPPEALSRRVFEAIVTA